MVQIGQKVTRIPKTIGVLDEEKNFSYKLNAKPLRGTVVYVHPKNRFHVVEFENARGDKIRETFEGVN